jgi:predicted class III extradiol MEMO1 family dioxygenase
MKQVLMTDNYMLETVECFVWHQTDKVQRLKCVFLAPMCSEFWAIAALFLSQMLDNHPKGKFDVSFTKYDQSSKCMKPEDSSVSYASALVREAAAAAPAGDELIT